MAPRRNVSKALTPIQEIETNPIIRRNRVVKPKPKPCDLEIKIPVQSIAATNELRIKKKQMTPQIKIDLANQVARAQLVKPMAADTPPPETKKSGRPKKVVSDYFANSNEETVSQQEPEVPVVATEKKMTKQTAQVEVKAEVIPKARKATVARKRVADSTVKKPIIKRQRIDKEKIGTTPSDVGPSTRSKLSLRKRANTTEGKANNKTPISTPILPTLLDPKDCEPGLDENKDVGKTVEDSKPALVESRKTSLTSNSSLSWTKDISDSSAITCITVTSKDFVRIDKKLPVVSVKDIKPQITHEEVSSSVSNSSNSSVNEPNCQRDIEDLGCDANSHLNLSTSSISAANSISGDEDDHVKKIGDALDKLSAKLKHFDLEMVDWIGYANEPVDTDSKDFQTKIFQVLKEEHEVIMHCQQLKMALADETAVVTNQNDQDYNFTKPHDVCYVNYAKDDNNENNEASKIKNNLSDPKSNKDNPEGKVTHNNIACMALDPSCDDDDALSLFAESIAGFDSSKASISSVPNNFEEYVPESIVKEPCNSSSKVVYHPSKIVHNDVLNNKMICEKQRADSTSIKELDATPKHSESKVIYRQPPSPTTHQFLNYQNFPKFSHQTSDSPLLENKLMPTLLAKRFEVPHGTKSILFKHVCFFNLIRSCKNEMCCYPHAEPDPNEIKTYLERMNETMFIQEYLLMRNWPLLRRKYGLCFVEEARRRDLTRVLVEMAMDFNAKATKLHEDIKLQVEVNELVLLHLNDVDLNEYADILNCKAQRQILCDIFMETIAHSQNFSRFKSVFLNLTAFIKSNGRLFSLGVTELVLERICILPCDERLVRAMLLMIQNTDCSILQNSMITQFERQLLRLHIAGLYDEFVSYKKEALVTQPVLVPYQSSPQMVNEVEPLAQVQMERERRYTSPDTTNLDNMNKTAEPVITRTITMNPSRSFNASPTLEHGPYQYQHWNKGFVGRRYVPRGGANRRPTYRRPTQRQVSYRHSPTEYSRGPGPDF